MTYVFGQYGHEGSNVTGSVRHVEYTSFIAMFIEIALINFLYAGLVYRQSTHEKL